MERLTKSKNQEIVVDNVQEAIKRLAQFEDFYYDLIDKQEEITKTIHEMQENMQTKQYRYREMSAQKVTNNVVLRMLKEYGIKSK